eukprot:Gb_18473 [translate_table: standard]
METTTTSRSSPKSTKTNPKPFGLPCIASPAKKLAVSFKQPFSPLDTEPDYSIEEYRNSTIWEEDPTTQEVENFLIDIATSWELYGSGPMVRLNTLIHATATSADDLSLTSVLIE